MKKIMNKKGFTLMEMLIVVAIIVILVAIAVPTFTGQLNNAKSAVDEANMRGARGIAANMYMMEGTTGTFYYDAEDGKFEEDIADVAEGYGQSTEKEDGQTLAASGNIIQVVIANDGTITMTWVAPSNSTQN